MVLRRLVKPVRSSRRITALATSAALICSAAVAVSSATAVAHPAPPPQSLTWGPCPGLIDPAAPVSECAVLTVPQDWEHPGAGPTLSIEISRVRATDPTTRKGILFTNPGGPGGDGIGLPARIAQAQPELSKSYDLIGMDPRGVGASTNLGCLVPLSVILDFYQFDVRDSSPAAKAMRARYSKSFADGCAKNPMTRFINTWQTVHDMDAIRATLGESKLNYLGYSYGTWLGAKYAAVFPHRTGKVVLDSNTVWTGDLADAWEEMPSAMQRRMDKQFVPWLTRHPVFSKYLGATPQQVRAKYEASRAGYITAAGLPGIGVAIDSEIIQALYRDTTFPDTGFLLTALTCFIGVTDSSEETTAKVFACIDRLAREIFGDGSDAAGTTRVRAIAGAALTKDFAALDQSLQGSPVPLPSLAEDPDELMIPVGGTYFAVRCGDGGDWHTPAWWDRQRDRIAPKNWLAGYLITGTEACAYWSQPTHQIANPDARKLGPIVAVQSEFDPATKYENVTRDLKDFRNGRLISVDDAGMHGVYGVRGNGCVDRLVNDWLLRDLLPAKSTVCGTYPLPEESVVYPVDGPVDHLQTHRWGPRKTYPKALQDDLDHMIGSTR